MAIYRASEIIAQEVKTYLRMNGLSENQLAKAIGRPQSTVHRVLNHPRRRVTRTLLLLCKYAHIDPIEHTPADPSINKDLMGALGQTWNGTGAHARAIAKVIKSLRGLRPR